MSIDTVDATIVMVAAVLGVIGGFGRWMWSIHKDEVADARVQERRDQRLIQAEERIRELEGRHDDQP